MDTRKQFSISVLVAFFAAFLMLLSVFLPYVSATKEYKEFLTEMPDVEIYDDSDMTAKSLVNVSMSKIVFMCIDGGDNILGDEESTYIYIGVVAAIAVFAALACVCTIAKKPILTILFSIFSMLVFLLHNYAFRDSGVINGDGYAWGIGYYVFFAGFVLAFIGSVWLLINKIKIKRM